MCADQFVAAFLYAAVTVQYGTAEHGVRLVDNNLPGHPCEDLFYASTFLYYFACVHRTNHVLTASV